MKNILLRKICCIVLLTIATLSSITAQNAVYKNGIRQGRVVVKLTEEPTILNEARRVAASGHTAPSQYLTFGTMPKLSQIASSIQAVSIKPVFHQNPKFQERFEREGLHLWYTIDYTGTESPLAIADALNKTGEVQHAEVEGEIVLPQYNLVKALKYIPTPSTKTTTNAPYNDPMLGDQWHYNNTGQWGGLPGADINAFKAWERIDNSENKENLRRVIVAILDQGVDWSHEDLRTNMWTNTAELLGTPGVDDDGNGLIDDIYGFDFVNGYGSIYKGEHGTHVAGTVAAVNNNGIGVAGVAGGSGSNDGALLMSLPIIGDDYVAVANAFIYAADQGALITQNSWGFNTAGFRSEVMEEGIKYFVQYAGCDNNGNQLPNSLMRGGIAIFAAGNAATDGEFYPAAMPEVLSVVAVNNQNRPTSYTNYNVVFDVACYGGAVGTSTDNTLNQKTAVLSTIPNNDYAYMEGTSMATPHVSGIAALAISELGGAGFTNDMLRNYLTLTTRYNEDNYDGTYKGKMGLGIVDAFLSIQKNEGIPPYAPTNVVVAVNSDNYLTINFTAPAKPDGAKVEGYRVYIKPDGSSTETLHTISSAQEPGNTETYMIASLKANTKYTIAVTAVDIWGNESERSAVIEPTTAAAKGALRWVNGFSGNDINTSQTLTYSSTNTTRSFTTKIKNEGLGDASYRLDAYHHAQPKQEYPNVPVTAAGTVSMGTNGLQILSSSLVSDEYNSVAHFKNWGYNKFITYVPDYVPDRYIGEVKENGVMRPSSAAVKFIVPDSTMAEGFTLTAFNLGIRTSDVWLYDDEYKAPDSLRIRFEIYRGGNLPILQNRVYVGETVNYSAASEIVLTLPYRIFFEAGETFFIAIHFDKRYKYPLGLVSNAINLDQNYYSDDDGKTWKSLTSIYNVDASGFSISALSNSEQRVQNISFSSAEGFLKAGETKDITVTIDAAPVKEGRDTTYLVVSSDANQVPGLATLVLDFNLIRNDVVPLFGKEYYDFNIVSNGDEVTQTIKIYNRGMGNWPFDNFTLSNPEFSIVGTRPSGIAANDSVEVTIKFTPTRLGAASTQLRIMGRGVTAEVLIMATVVPPPVAGLSPEMLYVNAVGNTLTTATAGITNNSDYSLTFDIPELTKTAGETRKIVLYEELEDIYADSLDLSAGYRWHDNRYNPSFVTEAWHDISTDGIELTQKIDFSSKYSEVKLPFNFPYYNQEYKRIYMGGNGTLKLTDTYADGLNVPVSLPSYESPFGDEGAEDMYYGVIAPLWFADGSSGNFSKMRMFYKILSDRVVFQWQGVQLYLMDGEAVFQATLFADGNIEFKYKSLFTIPTSDANTYSVGWSNHDCTDGHTIWFLNRRFIEQATASESNPYTIKIEPPLISPIKPIENVQYRATVNPNGSKTVSFNIDPTYLNVGTTVYNLKITTNDPTKKTMYLPINITKTDVISVDFVEDSVHLGNRIFNAPYTEQLQLFNTSRTTGTVRLEIVSESNNILFENNTTSQTLLSEASKVANFNIIVADAASAVIEAYDENNTLLSSMIFVADKLGTDNIYASYVTNNNLTYNLSAGESATKTISITAPADKDLESNVYLPVYMSLDSEIDTKASRKSKTLGSSARIDQSGYRWFNSADEGAPKYIWNDISKTGEKITITTDVNYTGTELKFRFPFYGVEYDKIYVAASGRVSPFNLGWDVMENYAGTRRLPCADLAVPFIAAMWNRQWYYNTMPDAGIYIQSSEDKLIVQYHLFIYDWIVTQGYCSYQIILYKDGTIQMVYKDIEGCSLSDKTTIGIQGEAYSDTKGYTYSLTGSVRIKNETTITAKPVYGPIEIPRGTTKTFTVTADSRGQKGGVYNDHIFFTSKNFEVIDSIPTQVSISSAELLAFRESAIDFGENINGDPVDTLAFTVLNNGNQDLMIDTLYFEGADGERFSMFKRITLFQEMVLKDTIVSVTFPISLISQGSEVYYTTFKPLAENKTSEVILKAISASGQVAELPIKATSVLPSQVKITDINGNSYISYDLTNANRITNDTYKIEHVGGETAVKYKPVYEFVKPVLPRTTTAKSSRTSLTPGASLEGFNPVVLHSKQISVSSVPSGYINAEGAIIEPHASVSLIKDNAVVSLIGVGAESPHYSMACAVHLNAGEEGLLMSHVRGYFNTLGPDTAKYTVRVYTDCVQPSAEYLLYEKQFRIKYDIASVADFWLPLETTLPFAPYESFWVEVEFGTKLEMPIAIATQTDPVTPGNYYRMYNHIKEEYETFYEFDALWAIWAVQESHAELKKWFVLPEKQSELNAGESETFDVLINRLQMPFGTSEVKVSIESERATECEPLTIQFNKYKALTWTQFPTNYMLAKEGEVVSFVVKAQDTDYTPNANETQEIRYTLGTTIEGANITKQADGSALVTYKVPYTATFITNFNVEATSYVINNITKEETARGYAVQRTSVSVMNVNRPVVANSVRPMVLNLDAMNTSITLPTYYFFVDPDFDELSFGANVSSDVISLTLNENGFIFTPIAEGIADVVLYASDGQYEATCSFRINVVRPYNYAPTQILNFPNRGIYTGTTISIDLNDYFIDHDGDEIRYEAWTTDTIISAVAIEQSMLYVYTYKPGVFSVGLRAIDTYNAQTMAAFAVQAMGEIDNIDEQGVTAANSNMLTFSNNPARVSTVATYSTSENLVEEPIICEVFDATGRKVLAQRMTQTNVHSAIATLQVSELGSGVYVVTIMQNGKKLNTQRLMVVE